MALSRAEKAAFNDEIKDIKRDVDSIKKAINDAIGKKKKFPNIANYFNLELATRGMDAIERFVKMNDLSVDMLGIKNNTFLENARKEFYKVLQYMEEVVGKDIYHSLKENDDYLITIKKINPAQILTFVKRMNRILDNLISKFGQETKWKWTFVELQARIAIVTKNITSFSEIAKFRDPRSEFFSERRELMQLCKDSLTEAAKQYRSKYEMAGKARDDMKLSIDFLSALRKIHVLFGEDTDATKLKNIIDAAKMMLEAQDKTKDKESKDKAREPKKQEKDLW